MDSQKYKLYVNIALLYFEKQKIGEIFNSYNTRLTTINDNMKSLLNDINEFKIIDDTTDEKDKLLKIIDLVSKDNNNIKMISDEIINKCDDINVTNDTINNIVNTDSNDFNIIKSVCEDKLSETDKTIITGDLFSSSSNDSISDLEKIKRDAYNAKRRQQRLEKKNKTN
jgi:hypothetical protein